MNEYKEARRIAFMDALGEYIDARIQYATMDPEWRSSREVCATGDRLEAAFAACLEDV